MSIREKNTPRSGTKKTPQRSASAPGNHVFAQIEKKVEVAIRAASKFVKGGDSPLKGKAKRGGPKSSMLMGGTTKLPKLH